MAWLKPCLYCQRQQQRSLFSYLHSSCCLCLAPWHFSDQWGVHEFSQEIEWNLCTIWDSSYVLQGFPLIFQLFRLLQTLFSISWLKKHRSIYLFILYWMSTQLNFHFLIVFICIRIFLKCTHLMLNLSI